MAKSKLKTRLALARKMLGKMGGQTGFAKLIGVSESWLKKASCGAIPINSRMAALMQVKAGISARWILSGDGNPLIENQKAPIDFLKWIASSAHSSVSSEVQFAMMEAWIAGKQHKEVDEE